MRNLFLTDASLETPPIAEDNLSAPVLVIEKSGAISLGQYDGKRRRWWAASDESPIDVSGWYKDVSNEPPAPPIGYLVKPIKILNFVEFEVGHPAFEHNGKIVVTKEKASSGLTLVLGFEKDKAPELSHLPGSEEVRP